MRRKSVFYFMVLLCIITLGGCSEAQKESRQNEVNVALLSLDQSRSENGNIIPCPPTYVEDIRISILDRHYATPSFMEDFQNLSMMQIHYGYSTDGKWVECPSENYDLVGILQNDGSYGWEAAIGSHMVRIGQFLLINICVSDDPTIVCEISDTIDSQIECPFYQYHTYQYYVDSEGELNSYMDQYTSGYGYIIENPHRDDSSAESGYTIVPEFRQRYYIILDYMEIPAYYQLTLTIRKGSNEIDQYILTESMIKERIN